MPFVPDNPKFVPDESVSEIPTRSLMESALRVPGVMASSAIPYVTAAAAGGAVAGPLGAATAPLALGLSDLAAAGINVGSQALGSEFRVPAPSQIIRRGYEKVAPSVFIEPETGFERMVSAGTEGGVAALSQANALRLLASKTAPGTLQNVLAETGRAPGTQVAAAVPAASAQQVTSDLLNESEVVEDPYARLMLSTAAGLLGGVAGAKAAGAGAVIPNVGKMRSKAKNLYRQVDQSGVQFDSTQYDTWLSGVRGNLKSFDPAQHGSVELEIKNLEKSLGSSPTISQLDTARSNIQKRLGKSTDPNIRRLGSELIDELDDFILNSPVAAYGGNYQQATQQLLEARRLYAAISKSDKMEELVRRAKLRPTPLDTAIRAEFATFARNPRNKRLLTPEEMGFVEDVVQGGKLASALTNVSQALRINRTFGGGLYAGTGLFGFISPQITPTQALTLGTGILGARAATGAAANALARRRATIAAAQMRGGRAGNIFSLPVAGGTAAGLGSNAPEQLNFLAEQQRLAEQGF